MVTNIKRYFDRIKIHSIDSELKLAYYPDIYQKLTKIAVLLDVVDIDRPWLTPVIYQEYLKTPKVKFYPNKLYGHTTIKDFMILVLSWSDHDFTAVSFSSTFKKKYTSAEIAVMLLNTTRDMGSEMIAKRELNLHVDNIQWWKNNHVIDFIRNTLERTVDNLETELRSNENE